MRSMGGGTDGGDIIESDAQEKWQIFSEGVLPPIEGQMEIRRRMQNQKMPLTESELIVYEDSAKGNHYQSALSKHLSLSMQGGLGGIAKRRKNRNLSKGARQQSPAVD